MNLFEQGAHILRQGLALALLRIDGDRVAQRQRADAPPQASYFAEPKPFLNPFIASSGTHGWALSQ